MSSSAREWPVDYWSLMLRVRRSAIISDVTNASSRSRSLALVGIAFSICFTLGYVLEIYISDRK